MSLKLAIIATLLLSAAFCYGQDFDADSIYYTPISKTATTQLNKGSHNPDARIQFSDTVSDDRLVRYFFNLQIGTLIGCEDCAQSKEVTFTSSTIHGVTIGKKFRTGLGLGLDSYYGWQTLPMFASAGWDVFGTRNTTALFVQLDYGWALPWKTSLNPWEPIHPGTEGGRMLNVLGGLRLKYHDMRISFAMGGKFQQVSTYYDVPTYYYNSSGILMQGAPARTTIKESMSRLTCSIILGWK